MRKVTLTRACSTDQGTFGVLSMDGLPLCVTCEEPWKDNKRNISCIPAGEYKCVKYNSQKFTDVWEVTNVPNRSKILIHQGNTVADIEGCILVGQYFSTAPGVTNSRITLNMLRKTLPDEFILHINSIGEDNA